MTVGELIEQLKNYPGDMRVLTLGYEGGLNDTSVSSDDIIFDYNDKDTWYHGPHEYARHTDLHNSTKCLIITRAK